MSASLRLGPTLPASLVLLLGACGPGVLQGGSLDFAGFSRSDGSPGGSDDGGGGDREDGALPLPTDGGGGDDGGGGNCEPQNPVGCGCPSPGMSQPCYTGLPATRGIGLCKDGVQRCDKSGEFNVWGPCVGSITPTAEICDDGKDHNCNGKLGCDDVECAGKLGCCMPGASRSCYSGPMGTQGVGPCKPGMQTCDPKGAWTMGCAGEVLPAAEAGRCQDGVDNDCNGSADCKDPACVADPACKPKECQPGQSKPCYTGKQGTAGVGPCKPGQQTCDGNGFWSPNCLGEVKPGDETFKCNDGVDNDCNGRTDCDDLVCLLNPFGGCKPQICMPGQSRSCYSGPQGTAGVASCKAGMQLCAQDGKSWGNCMGEVLPGVEIGKCNDGLDNDCNGLADCKDPACNTAPNCCVPMGGNVDGTIYVHSPDTLYKLDPNTWNLTTIGNFAAGDSMTDVAVTPNGNLYAISFTALYSVDRATAKAKLIGAVPGSGNNSLTFLPDGSLLAADSMGQVKRINPASGQVTDLGNFGDGYSSSGDLVAVADGTMYGISSTSKGGGDASGDNWLLRVDVKSGKATGVGATGNGSLWGLAYANSKLIGFTNTGRIIQIDPATGKSVQVANKGVNFWGAGMSPLVPPQKCP